MEDQLNDDPNQSHDASFDMDEYLDNLIDDVFAADPEVNEEPDLSFEEERSSGSFHSVTGDPSIPAASTPKKQGAPAVGGLSPSHTRSGAVHGVNVMAEDDENHPAEPEEIVEQITPDDPINRINVTAGGTHALGGGPGATASNKDGIPGFLKRGRNHVNGGNLEFRQTHHFVSYNLPVQPFTYEKRKLVITPLWKLPTNDLWAYMSHEQFELLPPGSQMKAFGMDVHCTDWVQVFDTAQSKVSQATLNQTRWAQRSINPEKSDWCYPVNCSFGGGEQNLKVTTINPLKKSSEMSKIMYGPSTADADWDTRLGTSHWHIPYHHPEYLAYAYDNAASVAAWKAVEEGEGWYQNGRDVGESRGFMENTETIEGNQIVGKKFWSFKHNVKDGHGLLMDPPGSWMDTAGNQQYMGNEYMSVNTVLQQIGPSSYRRKVEQWDDTQVENKKARGYDGGCVSATGASDLAGNNNELHFPDSVYVGIKAFPKLPILLNAGSATEFFEASVTWVVYTWCTISTPMPTTRWPRLALANIPFQTRPYTNYFSTSFDKMQDLSLQAFYKGQRIYRKSLVPPVGPPRKRKKVVIQDLSE